MGGLCFVAVLNAEVSACAFNQIQALSGGPQVCEVVWTQAACKAQGVELLSHDRGAFS